MTSTKCETRQFHNEVMQSWQRNVEKKNVMHLLFSYSKPIVVLSFLFPLRLSLVLELHIEHGIDTVLWTDPKQ